MSIARNLALLKKDIDDVYKAGKAEGHTEGYNDGLAARTYETWEITLADGTVIEKEVPLL